MNDTEQSPTAEVWLVVVPNGAKSSFVDEPRAISYAARSHGVVHPMVRQYWAGATDQQQEAGHE